MSNQSQVLIRLNIMWFILKIDQLHVPPLHYIAKVLGCLPFLVHEL